MSEIWTRTKEINNIVLDCIVPNPGNPRKNFDQAELELLAQSMLDVGVLQPILVVVNSDPNSLYRLVAGERRWRAAKLAGLKTIPAIVKKLTPKQEAEIMLIENLQRKDLDAIEEARAYQVLLGEHDYTQETLGDKLGVSQSQIANRIRLLELPVEVQGNISRGIISPSVAKELLAGKKVSPQVVEKVAKKAADEGLTVKQVAEAMARETYSSSRPLTGGQYNSPRFNTGAAGCDKCKKKTMLKCPWADREELRCLDADCWDEKQGEFDKQSAEEKEKELNAKYPDAMIVTHNDDFFERLSSADYCREKGCNDLRKARYKGADWVMDICFNVDKDKYKACQAEVQQKKKQELADKKKAARAEIKELVSTKAQDWVPAPYAWINRPIYRRTLIYIAATILEEVTAGWQSDINVFQYIEQVANDVELDDVDENNEDTWTLEMLKRFSEEQLFRIIIEWPVLCNGIGEESVEEWYFKGNENLEAAAQETTAPAEPKTYLDENQGREVFVSEGLWQEGGANMYGSFYYSASGGFHRVKSPAMPMVATQEEAQANLDAWAKKKGLKPVTERSESA